MSGHSKWSKVKHQKATTDVVKGMAFTKAARAITIAVKEGGGADPSHNFRLRLAIEKAHDANIPKENIERAIEKGKGIGGDAIEQIQYEGYGPYGVAFLIDATTDNRQRTVAGVKNVLDRKGGTIASPGAVSYLFERAGILTIPKQALSYDTVFEGALESGASDVVETQDMFEVYTAVAALSSVKQALQEKGIVIDNVNIIMKPKTSIVLDELKMKNIDMLVADLESLDDIQNVFTNAKEEAT